MRSPVEKRIEELGDAGAYLLCGTRGKVEGRGVRVAYWVAAAAAAAAVGNHCIWVDMMTFCCYR